MQYDENKELALQWLRRAQSVTGKGFSAWYSPILGWADPYPETTGYIIPTILNTDKETAQQAGNWLLSIQFPDGSFPQLGSAIFKTKPTPLVFDTGQIIFGLVALYKQTKDKKYIESAKRAGNWIIAQQETTGEWKKYAYQNKPHTYYTRVSWALLELYLATKNNAYKKAAQTNIKWTITQQQPNGWFMNSGFYSPNVAVLHTITYTIEGLIECGKILKDKPALDSARLACEALLHHSNGIPYGHYDSNWNKKNIGKCITGIAQTALCLLRLDPKRYKYDAEKMLNYLCTTQNKSNNPNKRGALPGSVPFYGTYMPFRYPNWAAKFFIDAINEYQQT